MIPSERPGRAGPPRRLGGPALVSTVVALMVFASTSAATAGVVITAAGDIAAPGAPSRAQIRTARLVRWIDPRIALALGDNQYPDGSLADYRASYRPTWGRFRRITRPVPGNHEYHQPHARGYFAYFGKHAHRRHGGYYSFDVGAWHLIAINTGRGAPGPRQMSWIRKDLARNHDRCELAYWHHPRWSSGSLHGSDPALSDLWRTLFRAGVDVVLNAHEHNYERFTSLRPSGVRAPRIGIRQFVVGTGGAPSYRFGPRIPGSKVRITRVHGVLRMRLNRRGFRYSFISVSRHVLDHGSARCHR
jgi:acid phosphatase type 7